MEYGLFEHAASQDAQDEFEREAAERSYLEAEHAVEERFGEFLRHAKNKDEFNQRLALVKGDLYNLIAKYTMPTPGVVRRIAGALKSNFTTTASGPSDEHPWGVNNGDHPMRGSAPHTLNFRTDSPETTEKLHNALRDTSSSFGSDATSASWHAREGGGHRSMIDYRGSRWSNGTEDKVNKVVQSIPGVESRWARSSSDGVHWHGASGPKTSSKASWAWDNQNKVFRSEGRVDGFTCPGCDTHHSQLGFTNCKCGKVWNSWTISPTPDNKLAGGQVVLCREVKVRDTVLSSVQKESLYEMSGPHEDSLFGTEHDHWAHGRGNTAPYNAVRKGFHAGEAAGATTADEFKHHVLKSIDDHLSGATEPDRNQGTSQGYKKGPLTNPETKKLQSLRDHIQNNGFSRFASLGAEAEMTDVHENTAPPREQGAQQPMKSYNPVPSQAGSDPLDVAGQGQVSSANQSKNSDQDEFAVEAAGKKKDDKSKEDKKKDDKKDAPKEKPSSNSSDTPSSAPSGPTDSGGAHLPISVKELKTHKENGLTAVCEGCGTAFNHQNVSKMNGKAHCPGCQQPATSANTLFVKRAEAVSYNEEAFIEGWKRAEAGETVPETDDRDVLNGYVAFLQGQKEAWTGDLVPDYGSEGNSYADRTTVYRGSEPPVKGMPNTLIDDHIPASPSDHSTEVYKDVRNDYAQRADRLNDEGKNQDAGASQDPTIGTPPRKTAPNSNR